MNIALTACFAATVAVTTASAWAQDAAPLPVETIPAGVPLRVELDKSYRMRVGTAIEGHLIEPVYLVDHVVLPKDSKIFGAITGRHGVTRQTRTAAMFNGDLTPLKEADVTFNDVETPDGRHFQIETDATERTAKLVHMASDDAKPRRSFGQHIAAAFRWTKNQTIATLRMQHKSDSLRQMLYQQIPVHPQEIWVGTQYDAELTQPVELQGEPTPTPVAMANLSDVKLTGTIEARLVDPVDSNTARPGTPVEAVLTQPLFSDATAEVTSAEVAPATMPAAPQPKLLLPEGTHLIGTVVQTKSAAMFGRNGALRLTFRKAELPEGDERVVHGQMVAVESLKGSSLKIDDEGGARATSSPSRFLAPLSLGALAAVGDNTGAGLVREAMAGNGMDMLTRVVGTAISNGGLITTFGYYEAGKVVYDQWIARGHDVVFPKNTRIEIELAQR